MIKSSQRGFTLIELVVVIVILGILAAFAVPRFMGLETEARVSAVKSMGGTLRSAASMAHALCMAQNCGAAGTVKVDNNTITMVQMYPNRASIQNLLQSVDGFNIANNGNGGVRFSKKGARNTNNCWIQYNQASATAAPTIQYRVGQIGVNNVTEDQVDADLRAQC